MKTLILFLAIIASIQLRAQQLFPYNDELPYKVISSSIEFPTTDSIKALIIKLEGNDLKNFEKTIVNNPQVIEIKLIGTTQQAADILSANASKALTYLFLIDVVGKDFQLKKFPYMEVLSISSFTLIEINMVGSELNNLGIVALQTPKLSIWKTDTLFPELSLVDLLAPELNTFPIKSSPKLFQMVYTCSLNEIPAYLCSCEELKHISFNNTKNITIDPCFIQKLETANYSNITIYENLGGPVKMELLSNDRK